MARPIHVDVIPRRNLVTATALFALAMIWSVGTHDYTGLLVGAFVVAAFVLFLWQRSRGGNGLSHDPVRSRKTEWAWWETQLAGGLLMLVVALIAGEWVLAGLAAFIAAYAGLVMTMKHRRSHRVP